MPIDPWGRFNEGLQGMQNTMLSLAALKRQDAQDARANSLQDLQMQGAQQKLEEGRMSLADLQAKQGALVDQYGTTGQPDAYPRAVSFQAQEKQMEEEQDHRAKRAKSFTEAHTKFAEAVHKGEIDPEEANNAFKTTMKMAGVDLDGGGIKVNFSKGGPSSEIERDFKDGELKDPMTGQSLPAGRYAAKGKFTGDPANPFQLLSYKMVDPNKDHETWGEPYQATIGGKKAMVQKSSRGQVKPVIQDTSTTVVVKPGHDAPKPAKPLPAGTLADLNEASQMIKTLKEAQGLAGSVNTGPIMGRLQSIGQKVGMASDDFSQFKQKLASVNNAMLKLRSGAAVTESEYSRFLQEMPTQNDDEKVRDTKLANAITYAENLLDGKISTFEEGGYKIPSGVKGRTNPAPAKSGKSKTSGGVVTKGGFKVTVVK